MAASACAPGDACKFQPPVLGRQVGFWETTSWEQAGGLDSSSRWQRITVGSGSMGFCQGLHGRAHWYLVRLPLSLSHGGPGLACACVQQTQGTLGGFRCLLTCPLIGASQHGLGLDSVLVRARALPHCPPVTGRLAKSQPQLLCLLPRPENLHLFQVSS